MKNNVPKKLMVDKIRRVQKMLGNEEFKLKSLFKKKRKKILRYLTAKKEKCRFALIQQNTKKLKNMLRNMVW